MLAQPQSDRPKHTYGIIQRYQPPYKPYYYAVFNSSHPLYTSCSSFYLYLDAWKAESTRQLQKSSADPSSLRGGDHTQPLGPTDSHYSSSLLQGIVCAFSINLQQAN